MRCSVTPKITARIEPIQYTHRMPSTIEAIAMPLVPLVVGYGL